MPSRTYCGCMDHPLTAPDRLTVLPFTGLDSPFGIAVDNAGDLFVTDSRSKVVKLAAN
jgi:hypothetical protein